MLPPIRRSWETLGLAIFHGGEVTCSRSKSVHEDACNWSTAKYHKCRKRTDPGDVEVRVAPELVGSVVLLKNAKGIYEAQGTKEHQKGS